MSEAQTTPHSEIVGSNEGDDLHEDWDLAIEANRFMDVIDTRRGEIEEGMEAYAVSQVEGSAEGILSEEDVGFIAQTMDTFYSLSPNEKADLILGYLETDEVPEDREEFGLLLSTVEDMVSGNDAGSSS